MPVIYTVRAVRLATTKKSVVEIDCICPTFPVDYEQLTCTKSNDTVNLGNLICAPVVKCVRGTSFVWTGALEETVHLAGRRYLITGEPHKERVAIIDSMQPSTSISRLLRQHLPAGTTLESFVAHTKNLEFITSVRRPPARIVGLAFKALTSLHGMPSRLTLYGSVDGAETKTPAWKWWYDWAEGSTPATTVDAYLEENPGQFAEKTVMQFSGSYPACIYLSYNPALINSKDANVIGVITPIDVPDNRKYPPACNSVLLDDEYKVHIVETKQNLGKSERRSQSTLNTRLELLPRRSHTLPALKSNDASKLVDIKSDWIPKPTPKQVATKPAETPFMLNHSLAPNVPG